MLFQCLFFLCNRFIRYASMLPLLLEDPPPLHVVPTSLHVVPTSLHADPALTCHQSSLASRQSLSHHAHLFFPSCPFPSSPSSISYFTLLSLFLFSLALPSVPFPFPFFPTGSSFDRFASEAPVSLL